MVRKAVGQASLVEALLPAAFGSNQRLERIRVQVDWQPIEALLGPMRGAPTGRPAYPPLVQLKALLLQHLRCNRPCRSCWTARVQSVRP